MLELKNIQKQYETGGETVHALKGVSIKFRQNEFVSILGQSGCGKTTLLNIMGGLDHYTSGDLIINGKSTKEYKDADWDFYRNHSIGFVFQSYNLIPHQTVLANVELALTISGVSRDESRQRAIDALKQVGLEDQIRKKPSQMSGGQMQRVAIARALVNDPDILLADEPTGALDSETSIQIMKILKRISQNKLVIMVTHNPELAKEYSTRIIKLSDGKVINDSNPVESAKKSKNVSALEDIRNRSMSFKTSLKLSLNNLMTKKARTLLTAFAGSIGIIGIALILSVSTGFQDYIDGLEENTLSTYPLTIQNETADMTSMIAAFGTMEEKDDQNEKAQKDVIEQQLMSDLFASIGTNDLVSFKQYLDKRKTNIEGLFNSVSYGYGLAPQIYSVDDKYGNIKVSPGSIMSSYMGGFGAQSLAMTNMDVFFEMVDNQKLLKKQYNLAAGKWPAEYNELLLVLQDKNKLNDYIVYTLGMRDPEELKDMINEVMKGNKVKSNDNEALEWSYDDLLSKEFALVPASEEYSYNSGYGVWEDMTSNNSHMKTAIQNAEKLHIVGIVYPKEGESALAMSNGIGYLPSLTQHVIEVSSDSAIVKQQLSNKTIDVFSGKSFDSVGKNNGGNLGLENMISIDKDKLSGALGSDISEDDLRGITEKYATSINDNIKVSTSSLQSFLKNTYKQALESIYTILDTKYSLDTENFSFSKGELEEAFSDYYKSEVFLANVKKTNELCNLGEDACFIVLQKPLEEARNSVNLYIDSKFLQKEFIKNSLFPNFYSDPATRTIAEALTEAKMKKEILTDVANLTKDITTSLASAFHADPKAISEAFAFNMTEEELTRMIQAYMSGDESTSYEGNLRKLGYADPDAPLSMSFYLKDFEAKETFLSLIDKYNDKMKKDKAEEKVISYTDLTGVMIKSVKSITNAVSYVLIAFVAISLIVSSIMIGVITYISVLERTKEIGILRAIGASKRDIGRVFNSETIIVGFCAGLIGIITSLLLLIPINVILQNLTKITSLKAVLPIFSGLILIAISIFLTYIAGLIPSGMASRKDPVEALRTE